MRGEIDAMVHCTGGAQTKVLYFVDEQTCNQGQSIPYPLHRLISYRKKAELRERKMYKVFNIGSSHGNASSTEAAEKVMAIAARIPESNPELSVALKTCRVQPSNNKKSVISRHLSIDTFS